MSIPLHLGSMYCRLDHSCVFPALGQLIFPEKLCLNRHVKRKVDTHSVRVRSWSESTSHIDLYSSIWEKDRILDMHSVL